jgi:hypothetical protein
MNSNNKFKRLNSAISNKSFKSQNKQLKRTLTSRSTGKTRQTTKTNYNRSKSIALTGKKDKKVSFKTLKEKDEYDNIYLKDLISKKQREIKQLKDDLRIVYLQEKGEGYLQYELELWKQKTETIGRDFIDNLNQIKEKLYYDKLDYQNQIKQLKQLCEFNFKNTYEKCEDIISKQEFLIKNLSDKNEDLRKRVDRMKSIFNK